MGTRPLPTAEGQLSRTPFAHVLLYMRERQLSGSLTIQAPDSLPDVGGESILAFDRGALAQVKLPSVVDPLGFAMRDLGLIDDAALNESLARLARGEGLQGEILKAMGKSDDATLESALRAHVRRKALRLFAVNDAPYAYYADLDLLEGWGGSRLREDVLALVWRGVRAYPDARAIDAILHKVGSQYVRFRATADLRVFEFDRNAQAVIDVLRYDSAPLDALLRAGSDPILARAIVYVLLISKQAEIVPPGTHAVRTHPSIAPPEHGSSPPVAPPQPALLARTAPPTAAIAPVANRNSAPRISPTEKRSQPKIAPGGTGIPDDIPADLRKRYEEARQRIEAMEDETYFQMLGIPNDASAERARTAFLDQAARWHPDRAPASAPSLRQLHERIFAYLTEAQETLTSTEQAGRYLSAVVEGGGTPNAQRRIHELIEAATDAQKAEVCLRRREYDEAERLVRKSLTVSPDDPNTLCTLATVLIERRPDAPASDEAVKLLTAAVTAAPKHDKAHMLLGAALKRRGDLRGALDHFQAAVDANPRNMEAAREIRLANMRSRDGSSTHLTDPGAEPKKKSEGLFGRFLKK